MLIQWWRTGILVWLVAYRLVASPAVRGFVNGVRLRVLGYIGGAVGRELCLISGRGDRKTRRSLAILWTRCRLKANKCVFGVLRKQVPFGSSIVVAE